MDPLIGIGLMDPLYKIEAIYRKNKYVSCVLGYLNNKTEFFTKFYINY